MLCAIVDSGSSFFGGWIIFLMGGNLGCYGLEIGTIYCFQGCAFKEAARFLGFFLAFFVTF